MRISCLVVMYLIFWPSVSAAAIVVYVEDAQIDPLRNPRTGSFEVFIQSDDPSPRELAGFQLRLLVEPPNQGFSITGIQKPERHAYAFSNQSPVGSSQSGGSSLNAGDFLNSQSTVPIADGLGLLKINFEWTEDILPDRFLVTVSPNPSHSFLSDGVLDHPFTAHSGEVTVIPEPATLVLAFVSLFLCIWGFLIRRR